MKFIFGLPMKPATKRLSGCSYSSSGVPTCSILPAEACYLFDAQGQAFKRLGAPQ